MHVMLFQCTQLVGTSVTSLKREAESLREVMDTTALALTIFKWMWKSCARGKHKFFFFCFCCRNALTPEIYSKGKIWCCKTNCVLCSGNTEETLRHLFFECPLSEQCWRLIKTFTGIQGCHSNI
jgi:hypothetical protein